MDTIRRILLLLLAGALLGLAAVAQAQDTCDLKNAGALADRADASYDNADYEGAIADYTCAIQLTPRDAALYNSRGNAYYRLRRYSEALADYQRALETDPEATYAYNNIGNIYYVRGDYGAAMEQYNIAVDASPNPEIPLYNRGMLYYEQGQYAEAITDYNAAIAEDSEYADAWLGRAWAYLVQDDNRAHADFLRWLELTQTSEVEQTLDEAMRSGVLEMRQGRVYRLTFDAQAGQRLGASARAEGDADPLMVLLGPAGTPLISDDDSGVNLDAVIRGYILPATGTYTLLVGQAGDGGTGLVDLAVTVDGMSTAGNAPAADTFATYKLFVNDTAEVFTTGGDHLNLRSGPGLNFDIVDRLERGVLVTLLEGPRKVDNYAWWRVRTRDGVEGWAVERVEEEQTLQLALLVGEDAVVTSGEDLLNVRVEPVRGADLAFQLEDGARVTLLEMPVIADNYRWWHIRDADGNEGWTVDRVDVDRMLVPAREFREN